MRTCAIRENIALCAFWETGIYFKQIRYLVNESKCTFFLRVGKNLGLQKLQIAHCCRSSVVATEKCLTLKLNKELT